MKRFAKFTFFLAQCLLIGLFPALIAALAIGAFTLLITTPEHEFVSTDGGFVMKTGFKTSIEAVEHSFERYKFLRGDSKMQLYRTTPLKPTTLFSKVRHYKYDPAAIKKPVDWRAELRQKCLIEYIPALPVVLEVNEIKFFFFNQYDNVAIVIYGISEGQLFALTIKNNPRNTASGKSWESPVWAYSVGIDIQEPHWRDVWTIVNDNREKLILAWEHDRMKLTPRFEPLYDQLF